jgi:hypothetical protein
LFDEIEDYVRRAVAPLVAEIAALKAQIKSIPAGPKGDTGERGLNGKDAEVDYDRIGSTIAVAVEKEVGKFPTPRDGRDGKDGRDGVDGKNGADGINGKDADADIIVRRVLELVPKPENGKDGAPGLNGKDGAPGKDGERGSDGIAGRDADESAIVTKVLALIPTPANGKDGSPGLNGNDGRDGIDGKSANEEAIVDRVLSAVEDTVQKAVGAIPAPRDGRDGLPGLPGTPGEKGIDGKDGFSPDDLEIEYDEDQDAILLRLRKGGAVVERSVRVPFPRDGGVYARGKSYRKGQVVTYGGSGFIAQRDTSAPIGGDPPSTDWRLFVKRGRDAS